MGVMTDPGAYDTPLSPAEEAQFQQWRAGLSPNLQSTSDYDLRGAWKANAQEAGNGHLPDTWKKPNHMTFSAESMYSAPQRPGGQWQQIAPPSPRNPNGVWRFDATAANLQAHTPDDLLNYFQAIENNARRDDRGQVIGYGDPNVVALPSMTR